MELLTKVKIPRAGITISHRDRILLLGSCFTQKIASRLRMCGFDIRNPFGAIYNPKSVESSFGILETKRRYSTDDIFKQNEKWHCYDFHSIYSHSNIEQCIDCINNEITDCGTFLNNAEYVIISLGTAQYYSLKTTGKVVANCHKSPASEFDHRMLSVDETTASLASFVSRHTDKQFIFTVSPVRYMGMGAHQSQISKSTLLLAIDALCERYSNCHYFPSYEIVMDELRDYRFYESDMIHVSETAADCIWERFEATYFDKATTELCREVAELRKMEMHRPTDPQSEQAVNLKKKIDERKAALLSEHAYLKL